MTAPQKASDELTPNDRARMAAIASMERKGIQHFTEFAQRDGVELTDEYLNAALINIMEEMRSRQRERDSLTASVNEEVFESYEPLLIGEDSMTEPDDSAEYTINIGPAVGAYADSFHTPSSWEEMFQIAPTAGYSQVALSNKFDHRIDVHRNGTRDDTPRPRLASFVRSNSRRE